MICHGLSVAGMLIVFSHAARVIKRKMPQAAAAPP